MKKKIKCEIYRDSMQNYKKYGIRPAQLIIADVPYCCGNNFYGSNPMWYKGGDNANGESKCLMLVKKIYKLQKIRIFRGQTMCQIKSISYY